jgi:hypothetical protein
LAHPAFAVARYYLAPFRRDSSLFQRFLDHAAYRVASHSSVYRRVRSNVAIAWDVVCSVELAHEHELLRAHDQKAPPLALQ